MRVSAVASVLFFLLSAPVNAQDYRKEIEKYVIDPCFLYMVRGSNAPGFGDMGEKNALAFVKGMLKDNVDAMEASVLPTVVGKSKEQRKMIYDFGRISCINGVKKGQR